MSLTGEEEKFQIDRGLRTGIDDEFPVRLAGWPFKHFINKFIEEEPLGSFTPVVGGGAKGGGSDDHH